MTAKTTSRPWRLAFAAAAVSAVAVVAVGAPALAAPTVTQTTGSLTIHKHETPASTNAGDGTELTPGPTSPAVEGVEFTITKIEGVDLSTNAGWLSAEELYSGFDASAPTADITGAYSLGAQSVDVTDAAGEISFTSLPIGLYLVEETATPDGVVGSAPFLVTIPITNPADDSNWIYNVHVYPKNSVVSIEKAVEDTNDYVAGDEVEWIITSEIPETTGTGAENITSYNVVDNLDPRLAYASTTVAVIDPAVALVRDTDYEVIVGDNDATSAIEDANTVSVVFLTPGLDKLEGSRASKVQVTINTTVLQTGIIPNTATLFTSNPFSSSNIDSNTVETCWGSLHINKVDANGGAPLPGATFDLYSSTVTNPTLADLTLVDPSNTAAADKVTITTAADGTASIDLIRCGDFEDNAALSPERTYYLVETTAPDGYELLAQPIPFNITYADVDVPSYAGLTMTVENVKKFVLPLTGGSGTAVIYLAGLALIVGGVVFLVIRRRGAKSHS